MKTNKKVATISGKELVLKSKNKLGKHLAIVQSGTGKHKNKKAYDRKQNKKSIRKELKDYKLSSNAF